jgi:hypothetical protein
MRINWRVERKDWRAAKVNINHNPAKIKELVGV